MTTACTNLDRGTGDEKQVALMMHRSEKKLLLLSGLDGTGLLFQPLINALQDKVSIEIVRYPTSETKSYDELVDFVGDIIQKHQSVYIVAESFSGPIALKLLNKYRNKIEGVILVATFITPPKKILLKLVNLIPLDWFFKLEPPDFFVRQFFLGKDIQSEQIDQFKKVLKLVPPEIIIHRLREILKLEKNEYKQNGSSKIVYIQALDDKLVSKNCTNQLKNIVPVDIKTVNGPHFLLQAKPKECAEIILDFTS